uniref:Secreted protein n=1 Tax=Noctiluca scintillans TaxID=2966 RepID=A0A7S1FCW6_NOCSC|mmetsp:Transcript_50583/g.134625  ORF Transcript_50583/g.134625 Transcript_50583/m.134625 type:complete len:224 (+) Transcript_50583:98-769(+)
MRCYTLVLSFMRWLVCWDSTFAVVSLSNVCFVRREECRTVVETLALLEDSSFGPGSSMATVAGFGVSALNGLSTTVGPSRSLRTQVPVHALLPLVTGGVAAGAGSGIVTTVDEGLSRVVSLEASTAYPECLYCAWTAKPLLHRGWCECLLFCSADEGERGHLERTAFCSTPHWQLSQAVHSETFTSRAGTVCRSSFLTNKNSVASQTFAAEWQRSQVHVLQTR